MKVYEVKKGHNETRGYVMMAVEGIEADVIKVGKILDTEFENSDYEEEGDKEGTVVYFWCVERSDVAYFRQQYKEAKKSIKK